jgi:predicted adenylyl cyclase CyaB
MKDGPDEIEVKFYLNGHEAFLDRLTKSGASIKRARCHEINILFDDVAGTLQASRRILRLRKDVQSILTYKGMGEEIGGVLSRREIEVVVSDFDTAGNLLLGLGYHAFMKYEKFRIVYEFNDCEVVLDELPYGWFCEIEGVKPQDIRTTARKMGLRWEARILRSYRILFEQWRQNRQATFPDLTFANFKGIMVTPEDLGVIPADV